VYISPDEVEVLIPEEFFVQWFENYGREFPWRKKGVSPFQLLLSEMLLRQTQAMQVERLWGDFMQEFGTVEKLVEADADSLFEKIEELGFGNQRVEALTSAAFHIVENHGGEVPVDLRDLMEVPHVGLYTARAVLCFGYGQALPIVDTNILRFFCRFTGRQITRPDIRREDWAWELAEKLLPEDEDAAEAHNYGILDFTAQVCLPSAPRCRRCHLKTACVQGRAYSKGNEPIDPW
jgi:A/G-specific adenine glycosylase